MSGVSLSYTIDSQALLQALERLANFDMRPVFQEIGEHLVSSTQQRFLDSVSPDGERWKPSQRVLAHRAKQLRSSRAKRGSELTLILDGHLRDSITYRASHDSVEAGSNLIYAAIHQFGGDAGRNHASHIDARPFLGLTGNDTAEIDAILAAHLARAIR